MFNEDQSTDEDSRGPKVQDTNPPSAPQSPENDEEELNVTHSEEVSEAGHENANDRSDSEETESQNAAPSGSPANRDEEGVRDDDNNSKESSNGEDSGSDVESSTGETGETREEEADKSPVEPWRNNRDAGTSRPAVQSCSSESSTQDGYKSTGPGMIDVPIRPDLLVPREYSWISCTVTGRRSDFKRGCDMSIFTNRLCGKHRGLWIAETMSIEEHVALWPTDLRFIVYDCITSTMNYQPPFTCFQQTVLATLGLAPFQLHPNGWAFMRAFELVCIHLNKNALVSLFLNIF